MAQWVTQLHKRVIPVPLQWLHIRADSHRKKWAVIVCHPPAHNVAIDTYRSHPRCVIPALAFHSTLIVVALPPAIYRTAHCCSQPISTTLTTRFMLAHHHTCTNPQESLQACMGPHVPHQTLHHSPLHPSYLTLRPLHPPVPY